ncbi:glycosyltransferase family 61 protein [Rhizosaccharibacter radicis]|uniref:Glycosyltransferase family 61 protein n=1 Tax=Rhizosaccharibacter radicis TaxID=2782605 RepID=A0ABT1VZE6_9PROT|nr:glycosyltransferase family 61 protein [Acetobacteraceae bacterium KSS12]
MSAVASAGDVLLADVAESVSLLERCRRRWLRREGVFPDRWSDAARLHRYRLRDVVLDAEQMVLFKDGRPIRDTNYLRPPEVYDALRVVPERLVEVPAAGGPVCLCTDATPSNWFHWIRHTVPSVWGFLRARAEDAPDGGGPGRLAIQGLPYPYDALLPMLGADRLGRITIEHGRQYRFAEVDYLDFVRGRGDFAVSRLAADAYRALRASLPPAGAARPLYVARTDTTRRAMRNETALIARLEAAGVRVLVPGGHGAAEQLRMFRDTSLVIGPHGAGLSSLVACRPGTPIYELVPAGYRNGCFRSLAREAGLRYRADAFPDSGDGPDFLRDWDVDVDRVLRRVERLRRRTKETAAGN